MRKLGRDNRTQILSALIEGSSINATVGYNRKLWIGGVKKSGVSLVSATSWTPPTRKGYATWKSLPSDSRGCNCNPRTF